MDATRRTRVRNAPRPNKPCQRRRARTELLARKGISRELCEAATREPVVRKKARRAIDWASSLLLGTVLKRSMAPRRPIEVSAR